MSPKHLSSPGIPRVGAVLGDKHDAWQTGDCRYVSEGSMALLKRTSETGSLAEIDRGELAPKINLAAHHAAGSAL